MIEKYINFETEKMLKDYNYNLSALKSLQEQYRALDGESGIDYSKERVQGSCGGGGVEKIALERVRLRDKIDDYKRDLNRIDYCLNMLPPDEKACLKALFIDKNGHSTGYIVDSLSNRLHMEKTAIYGLRRQALQHFEHYIFG